jgi:hypothetical protein
MSLGSDYTYTSGYQLKCSRNITSEDILLLCELLEESPLGETMTFCPEAITEGGIRMKAKDGSWAKYAYRSMRIYYSVQSPCIVEETVKEDWKNRDEPILLCMAKDKIRTHLKAFRGAPLFTLKEIRIWKQCLEKIGFECKKEPTGKSMHSKSSV